MRFSKRLSLEHPGAAERLHQALLDAHAGVGGGKIRLAFAHQPFEQLLQLRLGFGGQHRARRRKLNDVGKGLLHPLEEALQVVFVLLDLLFEMALQVAQEFQVGLRVEALDAAEVASEKAIQELLLGAVQEEPDVEKLFPLGVGDVTHQVIRAGFQAAFIRHGHFRIRIQMRQESEGRDRLSPDSRLLTPESIPPHPQLGNGSSEEFLASIMAWRNVRRRA